MLQPLIVRPRVFPDLSVARHSWQKVLEASSRIRKPSCPTLQCPMNTVSAPAQDDQRANGPTRIILVEDDTELRQGLAEYLRWNGLLVTEAASGLAFYKILRSETFDIAILDINLPDTTGYELAKDISSDPLMGIIMLTARTRRDDRVRGYSEGADLYLTKPVDGEELLLAVRNLARRVRSGNGAPPQAAAWQLDPQHQRLSAPNGTVVALSGREVMLLEQFAKLPGATISRRTLSELLGYGIPGAENRALDAALRRLRQKASESGTTLPLNVVHSVGIRFTAPLVLAQA